MLHFSLLRIYFCGRVCISLPLPHGSVLRKDSFWMRINTRKLNVWLPSSSRLFCWEVVQWRFGVMILITAWHNKIELAQLFMQSVTNLKIISVKGNKSCLIPTACTSTLFIQHWGIKEVPLMKSITAEKNLQVVKDHGFCTKMREILGQAVIHFGYRDLEEELSRAALPFPRGVPSSCQPYLQN